MSSNYFRKFQKSIVGGMLSALLFAQAAAAEPRQVPEDSPRVTDNVRLIRQCIPAVVAIKAYRKSAKEGVFDVGEGSGSVVHENGYILTNAHVVQGAVRGEAALHNGKWRAYRVIAQFNNEDLAIIKIDADEPLSVMPLGRSDDLMLGEPTVTIGSPAGLVHTVSTGVVSGLGRATNTEHAYLPSMIQTSAAISGGSSGGPLINALGEQIGVITSRKTDAENIGFAIAVDRIREVLPKIIAAEERYGFWLGLEVDTLSSGAIVTKVYDGSPAATIGVKLGDVLTKLDKTELRTGVDVCLALLERKEGQKLPLAWRRGEENLSAEVTLGKAPVLPAVADEKMQPGLEVSRYEGKWQKVPNFDKLKPKSTAVTTEFNPDSSPTSGHAIRYRGFVKAPRDGLYVFYSASDDGSRVWIGDRLVVDNDGEHSFREASGIVRLAAGLHPITIGYFDAGGDHSLEVSVEGPELSKRPLPEDWLFHQGEAQVPPPAP